MPIFSYSGVDSDGKTVTGKVEAEDVKSARKAIKDMGYVPVKLYSTTITEGSNFQVSKKVSNYLQALTLKEKMDFTSTFQTLQKAGIPVIEALIFMEQDASSRRIRMLAREVRTQVIAGSTFSDTISRFPEIFGAVYIGLVKAGEESGEMERTLERLLDLMNKEAATRGKVFSALAYPVFVVVLAHAVVLIMLIFVFPAFKEMFDTAGADLPLVTQICISAGEFLKAKWYLIPVIIGTIFWTIYYVWHFEPTRKKIDEISLTIPILGDMIKYSSFSNFLSVLEVSYEAGIPVVNCLYLSNMTFVNSTMNKAVNSAIKRVKEGMHLSQALRTTKIFPQMILFMISTGEQSGRLGDLMKESVKFIDTELDRVVDTMTKMIEPIMLIFIGALVCFLALALYMPLFQSYQLN